MQHRYVSMTSYLTSSKMPFTDKDGHLIKAKPLTNKVKRKSMTLKAIWMVPAKNYENISKFVKVMPRILWLLFYPDTLYICRAP